ncbi:MAG TPA: toll/interleukin-1 receptor domain-containing protein, partial [Myxococcota bacterium]|nr:toll/interleukin-1 receptor domain-containing protein [Myxococcota bacterium]
MELLISWSGSPSKEVAHFLRQWLPAVIQAVHPWISEADIAGGAKWREKLDKKLETTNACVVCV